jgi:hypothetical protein
MESENERTQDESNEPRSQRESEEQNSIVNDLQPLYFLKDGGKIKIYTDASDYAIGGYVCQVIDDKEYPI